jgi:glycosyltransferase involved in cell wall biosynthesis
MPKKILMIPFHYPPMSGSSGVQRSLFFSRHLSQYEWNPIVLTAHPRVHPQVSSETLQSIPEHVLVKRVFAFDVARHLAYRGRYFKWMAIPDRWSSWFFAAVWKGWWIIKNHQPDIIWSTYPIATSHLIALMLNKISGIPWVADFRDPMTEEGYPADPLQFKIYRWIEQKTIQNATCVVVTTPGVKKMYLDRYAVNNAEQIKIIQNGYDEDKFQQAEESINDEIVLQDRESANQILRIVHSGYIYPDERNPKDLFKALSELKVEKIISSNTLRVELRATGFDEVYGKIIAELQIDDIVHLLPAITHEDCIQDMLQADGLLLLQAANCNYQIPAKVYEYLRANKPIIALTDPEGDTAALLKLEGIMTIARLDDKEEIKDIFLRLGEIISQSQKCKKKHAAKYSRQHQTKELVELLNHIL